MRALHRSRRLRQNSINGADPDPKLLRYLAFADALRTRGQHGLLDAFTNFWAAQRLPLRSGPPQTGLDPLLNHGSFELGKYAHHLKHRFASRRCCVDALLVEVEINAHGVKLAQEADQVLQGPTQAINRPGHDNIELAARGVFT